MKQLEFKLITNNETIIYEKSNYFIKENILNFKAKEELYTFDLENNLLKKKNDESIIKINLKDKLVEITLVPQNLTFDMEIIDFKIENKENNIKLEYTFENDEKTTNCIIINY